MRGNYRQIDSAIGHVGAEQRLLSHFFGGMELILTLSPNLK